MYIYGDTHGENGALEDFILSNEKIMLQLGDFGYIWKPSDLAHNKNLDIPRDKVILFVPGNHENYAAIQSCPLVSVFGGLAREIKTNVFALERGEVFSVEGWKFLAIGGGDSVDIPRRIEGVSWWPEERITDKDIARCNQKVDFIASHSPPEFIETLYVAPWPDCYSSTKLNKLESNLYDSWYFGHLHLSCNTIKDGKTYKCLNIGESLCLPEKRKDVYITANRL